MSKLLTCTGFLVLLSLTACSTSEQKGSSVSIVPPPVQSSQQIITTRSASSFLGSREANEEGFLSNPVQVVINR